MATWAEFANDEPELAAFGLERMAGRIVYQATLRLDGSPRVHPVSPWIASGLLCVSFRARSPKVNEVSRDARYALHSAQPWEDHMGDHGEFMLARVSSQDFTCSGSKVTFPLPRYTNHDRCKPVTLPTVMRLGGDISGCSRCAMICCSAATEMPNASEA